MSSPPLLHNRYQVVAELGNRAGATVQRSQTFRAFDHQGTPPCLVALKRWGYADHGLDQASADRTIAQYQALTHPQMAQVIDGFVTDSALWLVQQWVTGRSLETTLAETGRFTTGDMIHLLQTVLPVLNYLHAHGIIHGRLTPHGIMVPPPSTAGVASPFIITALPMAVAATGMAGGTADPEYAAPEQLRGQPSSASDLYSLGLICIHLLTDLRPFDLRPLAQPFEPDPTAAIAWQSYWPLDDHDPATQPNRQRLADLLDQMIAPSLSQRSPTPQAVLQTLRRVGLHYTPATTPPPSASAVTLPLPAYAWVCQHTYVGHGGLFGTVTSVVLSANGDWIASGSDDKTVRLWSTTTGQALACWPGDGGAIAAIGLSPDGRWLASGNHDGTVSLWSLDNFPQPAPPIRLTGHQQAVQAIQFSPTGGWLVSAAADKTIRIWTLPTGTPIAVLPGHQLGVMAVAVSADGEWIATGSQDRTAKLWARQGQDWNSGRAIATLTGHTWAVRAVAISPTGQWLATGSDDNTIRLWALPSGNLLQTLSAHGWTVAALAFSGDGRWLVSGSWDKTVKLWHVNPDNPQQLVTWVATLEGHQDSVCAVAIAADGQIIISGSKDRTVKLWRDRSACQK